MISETTFAKRFTSFWNELLPNAKNYTRLVNSGRFTATHKPLAAPARKQNTALVNVLSFDLYRYLTVTHSDFAIATKPAFFDSEEFNALLHRSAQYLQRFGNHQPHELPLTNGELAHVKELTHLLDAKYNWSLGPQVDPAFDGCGYLNAATGDIFIGDRLVEVKSGERLFSVVDFRQVITYCSLNHYSKSPLPIQCVEIFNPRMGALFSEDLNQLCLDVSALGSLELFSEVQRYISDINFGETSDT